MHLNFYHFLHYQRACQAFDDRRAAMKRQIRMGALILAFLLAGQARAAGLPDWLLGEWDVTRIYEEDPERHIYPSAAGEPAVWLDGRTMTVEPNRLELANHICANIAVREKRDTIARLVSRTLWLKPQALGLTPRPGTLPYLDIQCGNDLIRYKDGTVADRHADYIHWQIIPDGHDKIEMMF